MQVLKDHNDKYSSKRIAGWVLLAICVFFAFVDFYTERVVNNFIFGTMFGGAFALLGVETVVNGFRNRGNNQRQRDRGSNSYE